MQIRIELLSLAVDLLARVETLQTVLLEGVQEDVLSHFETSNEVKQVLVRLGLGSFEFFLGNGEQSTVKVVNALQKILGKALDGEVASILLVAPGTFLEVAEFGNGAKIFVLEGRSIQYAYFEKIGKKRQTIPLDQ